MKENDETKKILKPLFWIRFSLEDLKAFPEEAQNSVGVSLLQAQYGGKADNAKPLHGFVGASVLEVVENHQDGTYRAVYTVKMKEAIYVLHTFQKKSKQGIKTPKQEIELIKKRLKDAQDHYEEWILSRRKQSDEKK